MKIVPYFDSVQNPGLVIRVDDRSFNEVSLYKWSLLKGRSTWYAKCNTAPFLMHLFIFPPRDGFCTDHIDGDGLNNVISNLRHLTHSENIRRGSPGRPNRLGHRGIQFVGHNPKKPYRAEVTLAGTGRHIGYFSTLEEAIEARKEWLFVHGVVLDAND